MSMSRIKNPITYTRKMRNDFALVKRKLLKEGYRLNQSDYNELIDCITRLENYLEDEIEQILINP